MLHIMTKRASSQECEPGSTYQRPSTDCATLTGSHGTKPTQTPRHTQGERDDDAPCSRTGRLDALEAAVRPTLLCGVNAIPPNPSQLPCAQRHPTSKRVRRGCRRPATANATLTESDKLTPPASETHSLQSYHDQDGAALAEGQTSRSMDRSGGPANGPPVNTAESPL